VSLSFETQLQNFADLTVRYGVGLEAGRRLVIRAPVDSARFTRAVVRAAYRAGAPVVEVLWGDDDLSLARFQEAPADSFDDIPNLGLDALIAAGARGDSLLSVYASDPALLKEQDPELVARVQRATQEYVKPHAIRVQNHEVNWCVVAVPIASWATLVFPDAGSPEEAVDNLWRAIFRAVRADQDDVTGAWDAHVESLRRVRTHLNAKQYRTYHYTGPGTNLRVGMPDDHIWLGGAVTGKQGVPFIPNLPTEEVFSMPHRERVDGTVRCTKPLSYAGNVIEDFSFRFERGRIVEMSARKGQSVLQRLIDTDNGSRQLGEIALVPHSSPISQSGVLFYNTLFDENASSHFAIGRAYRTCVKNGPQMSDLEFSSIGGNESLTHVDFMIGSEEIDVDGETAGGEREPVMRSGEWAFDV
jgi:aminopeptidase